MNHHSHIFQASTVPACIAALQLGSIIAYPTEAVFGLGCDPQSEQAVNALCRLKQRPIEKGLILVAASPDQLIDYIDWEQLDKVQSTQILASWPGPYTWVMPAKNRTPSYLTGVFTTIAVRVSAHPIIKMLCDGFGHPIVSTSANLTGLEPAKTGSEVFEQFGRKVVICEGAVGEYAQPTSIRDALTGQVLRS